MARTKLSNLRVTKVDLVDFGASYDAKTGDGAHVLLYKRADLAKDQPCATDVHTDTPQKKKKKQLDAMSKAVDAADALIAKYGDVAEVAVALKPKVLSFRDAYARVEARESMDDLHEMWWAFCDAAQSILASDAAGKDALLRDSAADFTTALLAALPDPAEVEAMTDVAKVGRKISAARLAALRNTHEMLGSIIAEGEEAMPDPKDTQTADAEVQKRIDTAVAAAVAKAIEPLAAENAALKADIAKSNTAAADAQSVAKAAQDALVIKNIEGQIATDFVGVPGLTAADAPVIKAIRDGVVTKEQAERIEALLKGVGAAIKAANAGALIEVGKSGAGAAAAAGSAEAEINQIADKLVTDKLAKNRAEAITKMMDDRTHAPLFKRYDEEARPASRR